MAGSPEGSAEPDRELMARLAAGDRQALDPLMRRHYQRIYRIALGYLRNPDDALDAVQETFVKAFRSASRWDGRAEAGPWLTRIAVNHAIDRYRRERRRRASFSPLEDAGSEAERQAAVPDPSPERRALGRELAERISAALRALPERQRAVFVLRHYEEMTLEQIACALDLRLGTVKSTLHRALQGLRLRLEGLRA
jgi:RNA polymerase sigma-70 factor (ECF subfamily)